MKARTGVAGRSDQTESSAASIKSSFNHSINSSLGLQKEQRRKIAPGLSEIVAAPAYIQDSAEWPRTLQPAPARRSRARAPLGQDGGAGEQAREEAGHASAADAARPPACCACPRAASSTLAKTAKTQRRPGVALALPCEPVRPLSRSATLPTRQQR